MHTGPTILAGANFAFMPAALPKLGSARTENRAFKIPVEMKLGETTSVDWSANGSYTIKGRTARLLDTFPLASVVTPFGAFSVNPGVGKA